MTAPTKGECDGSCAGDEQGDCSHVLPSPAATKGEVVTCFDCAPTRSEFLATPFVIPPKYCQCGKVCDGGYWTDSPPRTPLQSAPPSPAATLDVEAVAISLEEKLAGPCADCCNDVVAVARQLLAEVKRLREEVTLIEASRDNLVTMTQRALRGTIARAEAAEKHATEMAGAMAAASAACRDRARHTHRGLAWAHAVANDLDAARRLAGKKEGG